MHILRYIKGTPSLGIFFSTTNSLQLEAFCDADWSSCSALVFWKMKKHAIVSKFLAEAEYRAMAATVCELQWVTYILHDVATHVSNPIPLHCDNKAAMHITANHFFTNEPSTWI